MANTIQPTVNSEQMAQISARGATMRYANPEQTGIWRRDLGPENPLPEATQAPQAQEPNQGFTPPTPPVEPNVSMNDYDPALGNNVDMFV
jgi:hypothetical protein